MNAYAISALTLSAALTAGCASTTPTLAELKPTPPERVFIKERQPDAATVTILRTREFGGSAVDIRVFANGQIAAHLGWSEWVSFPVPPGEVILEVRHPGPAIFGLTGDSAVVNATPNGKYFLRVSYDVNGPRLLRTTEASVAGTIR